MAPASEIKLTLILPDQNPIDSCAVAGRFHLRGRTPYFSASRAAPGTIVRFARQSQAAYRVSFMQSGPLDIGTHYG